MANLAGATLMQSDVWAWVIIPLMIACARILDVSIGTVRIILLARGDKLSILLGFVESLVWIVVISGVMQNLGNPASYVGWAAGFAAGTFVGLQLESRLAIGTLLVRIITPNDSSALHDTLSAAGFGVTSVQLIYTIIPRKHLQSVLDTIRAVEPTAFVSVDAVQSADMGIFPAPMTSRLTFPSIFRHRQSQKRK